MNSNNLQEAYLEVHQRIDELYKGKHGQSEKEYQAGRSDAGKRISGDEKHGPASYASRWHKSSEPTKPGEKPKNVQKLSKSEKEEIEYRKAKLKKEEVENVYEIISAYLLDEGFASTEESADKIILNMSESWFEDIMELNRYAKEKGKDFASGRSSVKGGSSEIKARNKAPFKYGGSREKPKVRGEKPPVAGEPGSGKQSPAHTVALRRANRERLKNQPIGSRFD
jgi:hypothetical protein